MRLQKIGQVLLGFWAVLSVAALGQFIYDSASVPSGDGYLLGELKVKLAIEVMVLNFPASLVVTVVPFPFSGPVAEWCVLTIAGYVQWVFLVPSLGGFLRRRFKRVRSPAD